MPNLLLTAATVSFFITFLAVPAVIRVADEKSLFDKPDSRKLHTKAISSLGGVGIFIGFFLSILLFVSTSIHPEFQFLLAASLLTFFLGIKDDILVLSASKKFLGQLVAAAIVIHMADIRIDSMHGFFGIYSLPDYVSYPLSYITIIVIVNAFNLIDGVDGLAGSLGMLTTAVFGIYFTLANMPSYAMLAFALTGSLAAFLAYNYHPAKIFMGDSGSLLLGLINAVLVIKFITVADSTAGSFPLTSSVAIGFSILLIPLLDTLRVFSVRIARGRSPFSPDRNHIHHLLLDRGLNHSQVTHLCLVMNIGFIALAYFGRSIGSTVLMTLMITTCYALIGVLKFWKRRPVLVVASSSYQNMNNEQPKNVNTKIVSFNSEEVAIAEQ
ncbi:MAG: undecaprenyl/decaprenyl-phosphate alpha-N-acetylglucosaminyl 1-phosphate transferase [Chitinophagaceae bacterium]|nr:MAG: undecaprenyl/decaprenyl-phosphate alpha-N-acetylglucosaminyl 1-phosphate transferase [Chitinophagaceae bacterium]